MSIMTRFLPLERRTLVADALLLAAAAGGAALALLTLLSEQVPDGSWYEPASLALMVAVVLVCPWVAWRLHGHHATGSTIAGVTLGALLGGFAVMSTAWLVAGIAWVVSWATGGAVSMGMVAFVLTAVAFLALLVWLDVDAVRDLRHEHRHVRLDVGRLAATAVALATVAGTLWWASGHPGEQPAELLEFSLVFGVAAATVALGADLTARPDPTPLPVRRT